MSFFFKYFSKYGHEILSLHLLLKWMNVFWSIRLRKTFCVKQIKNNFSQKQKLRPHSNALHIFKQGNETFRINYPWTHMCFLSSFLWFWFSWSSCSIWSSGTFFSFTYMHCIVLLSYPKNGLEQVYLCRMFPFTYALYSGATLKTVWNRCFCVGCFINVRSALFHFS